MTHTTDSDQIRTIDHVTRARSSRDGNPGYYVTFSDGSRSQTEDNAQVGYMIENSDVHGVPVRVTFAPNGRILTVKKVVN